MVSCCGGANGLFSTCEARGGHSFTRGVITVRFVALCLMLIFGLAGLLLIIAAGYSNFAFRLPVGIVCLAAAVVLGWMSQMRPVAHTHVHRMEVDLSGDVALEKLQCKQCGAELDRESVTMAAGAVMVRCGYCGAEYQLEEAAKW